MNDSHLIAVDIGNSSTKLGWQFEQPGSGLPMPRQTASFATGQQPPVDGIARLPAENCRWEIVSVHREGTRLCCDWIEAQRPHDKARVLAHSDLPISTRVNAPERVGMDRLAAAVAANALRTSLTPAIVVDAGSAITVDLIGSDGAFQGGVILPGFRMSAEALYRADLLPLAQLQPNDQPPPIVGTDTEGAIKSGLFWGAVGAVREVIDRMRLKLDRPPQIFVTGGDLRRLAEQLPTPATFVPNMVLSGIALASNGE
jgi:type III pantothenate kinase